MSLIVGVVDIVAGAGRADALVTAFEACAVQTHTEPGCLSYALQRDNANPDHFVILERWASQADLDEHMTKPWVADLFAFAGAQGNLAAAPSLSFLTGVPLGDPAKGSI